MGVKKGVFPDLIETQIFKNVFLFKTLRFQKDGKKMSLLWL